MPRVHEQDIAAAMAQECVDVDLSRGTLRPFRTDKKVWDGAAAAFYTDGCCVAVSQECAVSFAKLAGACGFLVSSSDGDFPKIARLPCAPAKGAVDSGLLDCGLTWCRLGFPCDLPALDVQALNGHSGDFNSEARQYYYTLVNDWDGAGLQESMPSAVSDVLLCHNDNDVVLSGIPTAFDGYCVRAVRIYCAVTGLEYGSENKPFQADFLLVGEVPLGTGVFVHKAHTVYGEPCLTEEYAPPPACMHSIQYCGNGQLGGIVGNELWLSEPLKPHAFPEAYRYGRFRSKPLRFLCGGGVGYVLTDGFPVVVETESPCQTQGCRKVSELKETLPLVSWRSAAVYNGACVYASFDGLVMMAGTDVRVISAEWFTPEQWQLLRPDTLRGAVHDGWYFGTTDSVSFRFKIPDAVHGKVNIDSLGELSIRADAWFRCDNDRLFFAADGGIFEWNAGAEWKEFVWRGRLNVLPGYTVISAYKVVHHFEPVRVVHRGYKYRKNARVADTVVLGDRVLRDSRPHRLKVGYAVLEADVEIRSRGEVREYHFAGSVAELGAQ